MKNNKIVRIDGKRYVKFRQRKWILEDLVAKYGGRTLKQVEWRLKTGWTIEDALFRTKKTLGNESV